MGKEKSICVVFAEGKKMSGSGKCRHVFLPDCDCMHFLSLHSNICSKYCLWAIKMRRNRSVCGNFSTSLYIQERRSQVLLFITTYTTSWASLHRCGNSLEGLKEHCISMATASSVMSHWNHSLCGSTHPFLQHRFAHPNSIPPTRRFTFTMLLAIALHNLWLACCEKKM